MFNESVSINGPLNIQIKETDDATGTETEKTVTLGNVNATIRSSSFDVGIRFLDNQTDAIKNNPSLVKQAIDDFMSQVNTKVNDYIGATIR